MEAIDQIRVIYYDPSKCMSIKNKGNNVQCCYDKKENSDYCGIHSRCRILIRIDSILGAAPMIPPVEQHVVPPVVPPVEQPVEQPVVVIVDEPVIKKRKKDIIKDVSIYRYSDFKEDVKISNDKIKRSCEYYELSKESFRELQRFFRNKLEPFLKDIKSIILIQKRFRIWNINRRNKSNNKEDCGTMELINDIPIQYYIDYTDEENFTYSFDIRSLNIILNESSPKNPFTQKKMNITDEFMKKFNYKINQIKEKEGGIVKFESPKLTSDQRYQQFLIRVFQKIDLLGHYTDTLWFQNMDLIDLKDFYRAAYDMFAYRAQLSSDIRKKIVKDGLLFNNFINSIQNFREKNKQMLQFEILREIERIVDEGEDKEYKILGANLILTVFVEISYEAALALPHLVQSSFN